MRYLDIRVLVVVLVWLVYHRAVCYSSSFTCSSCVCRNISADTVFADCSNRNLTAIPHDLPADTLCLDLTDNNITAFNSTENPFKHMPNLSVLSLSGNFLQKLDKNDLQHLEHLDKLDLSMNQIRYEQIAVDAFDLVPNLVYLDIKQNTHTHTANDTFTVQALSTLTKLKALMIDIVYMEQLGEEFKNLTHLEELYLSGTYGRCIVPLIRESFFSNVNFSAAIGHKLFHLYMSNCSIVNIEKDALVPLTNLTTLDLSWNQNLTFIPLQNVTADLGNAHGRSIRFLNINAVHKYFGLNECIKIPTALMQPLYNTSLQLFSGEGNRIINMELDAARYFPKRLEYVSLRDNMFLQGHYLSYLIQHGVLNNLVYYDAAAMFKTHLTPEPIGYKLERRMPDACLDDRNKTITLFNTHVKPLNTCCNAILKRYRQYDFVAVILGRVNDLKDTTQNASVSTVQNSSKPPHGDISTDIVHSRNSSRLLYLDISENMPGSVNVSISLFHNFADVLFLNMSLNLYGYIYFSKENASVFNRTTQLKVLDMSRNRIMSIWYNAWIPLSNLEQIYLSSNQLDRVNITLDHMKKLSYIDFSNNRIETITKKYRNIFDKLSNVSINLLNNFLKCSCSDLEFVEWIQTKTRVHFVDSASYQCTFDNGTLSLINNIALSKWRLECFPRTYSTLILALSLSLVTFCIILIGGLVYRFRWNLRYLYYMTKYKTFGGYTAVRNDETEYEKDIFVSYANEDSAFVRNQIIPQLQDFSLLIHERDFEAGQYVADNIMKAVSTTRRTLAILSTHYIRSKWCKHEMNMARLQGIDTGKEILCVILKENIPLNNVPLEIMDVLKKKTYLEYPQEDEHQAQFWERLNEALKH